jgi:hypothetical protein
MYESPVTITLDRKDDFIVRASRSRRSGKGWYHDIQILPRKGRLARGVSSVRVRLIDPRLLTALAVN